MKTDNMGRPGLSTVLMQFSRGGAMGMQVQAEVPGSPVFVMKHMTGVRHLEVQVCLCCATLFLRHVLGGWHLL